jgi:hypothetical protein
MAGGLIRLGGPSDSRGRKTTKLQEAAYNAQLAAGLPISALARAVLIKDDRLIDYRRCATYIHAVQQTEWFKAAFPAYTEYAHES